MHHYSVDVSAENGVVELTGQVTDQAQREEVLRIVQGVPGVERVRDRLTIAVAPVTPVMAMAQVMAQEREYRVRLAVNVLRAFRTHDVAALVPGSLPGSSAWIQKVSQDGAGLDR